MVFKIFPKRRNIFILVIFLIHYFDISAGLREYKNGNYFNDSKKILNNKFWNKIEKNFETISSTYLENPSPEFYALSGLLINTKLNSELIVSARYYKDGSEVLIPQKGKNPRRLTPRECARLQGFPDKFIIPVSNNQAYKQFGNSVVTPLIQAVAKNIVKELSKINESNQSKIAVHQ